MLSARLVIIGVLLLLHSTSTYLLPGSHCRTWCSISTPRVSPTTTFFSSQLSINRAGMPLCRGTLAQLNNVMEGLHTKVCADEEIDEYACVNEDKKNEEFAGLLGNAKAAHKQYHQNDSDGGDDEKGYCGENELQGDGNNAHESIEKDDERNLPTIENERVESHTMHKLIMKEVPGKVEVGVDNNIEDLLKTDFKAIRRKLLLYDNGYFDTIQTQHKLNFIAELNMDIVEDVILKLREELLELGESIAVFGKRHNNAIEGMIRSISQTFAGQLLYPTVEAQAAHLLYSIIKGHPFVDGNKRIAMTLFVKFLELNKYLVNKHGQSILHGGLLLTMVINVAESQPEEESKVIKSIVNMLVREATV